MKKLIFAFALGAVHAASGLLAQDTEPAVLAQKVVHSGGTKATYRLIEAPSTQVRPPQEAPVEVNEITEKRADTLAKQENKEHVSLIVTGTVYPSGLTEFHSNIGTQEFGGVSNIDFRVFPALTNLEVGNTVYTIVPLISASTNSPSWLPQLSEFQSDRAEYFPAQENSNAQAIAGFDALHVYFEANREDLIAQKIARDEIAADPPLPKPKQDSVITFWRKSSGN